MKRGLFAKFYNGIVVIVPITPERLTLIIEVESWLFGNLIYDHWDYYYNGNGELLGFEFKIPEDAIVVKLRFGV